MKFIYLFTFLFLSRESLLGQSSIDTLLKISSYLENKSWQIQSIEPKERKPEFLLDINLLDTTIVYCFDSLNIQNNELKGSYAITQRAIRRGEVVLRLFTDGSNYFFSVKNLGRTIIKYDDDAFLDEILELNDTIFTIKRIYKNDEYASTIIRFKKFKFE